MVRTCVENGKTVVSEEVNIVLYLKKKSLKTCWTQQRILWHFSKGYFAGDI